MCVAALFSLSFLPFGPCIPYVPTATHVKMDRVLVFQQYPKPTPPSPPRAKQKRKVEKESDQSTVLLFSFFCSSAPVVCDADYTLYDHLPSYFFLLNFPQAFLFLLFRLFFLLLRHVPPISISCPLNLFLVVFVSLLFKHHSFFHHFHLQHSLLGIPIFSTLSSLNPHPRINLASVNVYVRSRMNVEAFQISTPKFSLQPPNPHHHQEKVYHGSSTMVVCSSCN